MSVSTILTSTRGFVRSSAFLAATLALAAALPMASIAAMPVAVWDGDFSATQTGYTLNLSGNALSQDNSTITIDQDVGVKVDFTTGFSSAMTVMFKYSDLSFDAQKTIATSFCSGYDENRTGVYAASDGTINGIWNTANWGNPGSTLSASSGTLAFCYSKADGTSLYSVGAGSRSELYNRSDLKAGSDTAINGCTIGGERAKTGATLLSAATGMKITGIAIFDSILTEAEMTGYIWPSETQQIAVNANTSVAAINNQFDSSNYKVADVTVADGVTISVDAAFSEKIRSVSSAGTITLSAESQPDASYFSNVSFGGVKGALLRSWLTPGVLGVNFVKGWGNDTTDERVESDAWVETTDANGSQTLFDGLTKITWSAAGIYSYKRYTETEDDENSPFFHGYLDDGGTGVKISVTNVPYATYDVVIYASTDTSNVKFRAKTVNNVAYTVAAGGAEAVLGNGDWGGSRLEMTSYGVNAMRVKNLSGNLTISGGTNNGNRGGIAAIQIMPTTAVDKPEPEYELSLDGTAVNWNEGAWELGGSVVSPPLSGNARITFSASTTLTVDDTVALSKLVLDGADDAVLTIVLGDGASLVSRGSVAIKGGVLKQGTASVLGATLSVIVEDGGTFDLNGLSINAATSVYIAGDGAGNWPWALTSSSGVGGTILGGLYLTDNATIGGTNELKVGQTQSGYYCYLQGFTLTKTGAGAFTGTNMNTPGTGTIDVQGGAMSVNQWNNLNNGGGNTTVILHTGASLANGTDRVVPMGTLKLLGGTLTTTRAFKANTLFVGAGETANLAFADGASASLTGNLTVTAALTLDGAMAFNKDESAANDVVVTASGTMSSSGAVSVGAGVTLNLGTSRPTGVFSVDDNGTLAVQLSAAGDTPVVHVSGNPANIILYDENGVVVEGPTVIYDSVAGTITFSAENIWTAKDGCSFDTVGNWSATATPSENANATVMVTGDTDISVSGTYTLGALYISGSGVVSFTGSGSITASSVLLQNGVTLARTPFSVLSTSAISAGSGCSVSINAGEGSYTETAAISGGGSVLTYGNVTMDAPNSFEGGITAVSGTLSTANSQGFASSSADGSPWIVVQDGACVDIANTDNQGHVLRIAGKGVELADGTYSGAVKNSGNTYGANMRQAKQIYLTADAMVDVSTGWGLVRSGHNPAVLALNGYTLTMRGAGTVPMGKVNTETTTTGTLVLDGATLYLCNYASNLTGVNIVIKGSASVNFSVAPSAIGSLTFKPSATGTTATAWNLPAGLVPTVSTDNVDPEGLAVGDKLALLTVPAQTELTSETVSAVAGGRYTMTISGNTVTATVGALVNFMHYDFNAANSRAADSTYSCGNMNPSFVASKNGRAGVFDSSSKPYYGSNTSGKSPFHAGEMTVTSLLKVREANNTILWNFGSGLAGNAGIALLAKNSSTVTLVQWTNGAANGSDVVSVTDVDLMNKWHFVAFVANANGTTLYVDGKSATVDTVLPSGISGQGQFGSIHSAKGMYEWLLANGYLLDDWRVYDAALTRAEVKTVKREISPDPLFIRLR